jgi:hypothetical protein
MIGIPLGFIIGALVVAIPQAHLHAIDFRQFFIEFAPLLAITSFFAGFVVLVEDAIHGG